MYDTLFLTYYLMHYFFATYLFCSKLCWHIQLVLHICGYVICYSMFVAITARFNQSAYSVTENSGIIQLFLVLSSPSSFNETVQLINNNIDTDNSANGMTIHHICYV